MVATRGAGGAAALAETELSAAFASYGSVRVLSRGHVGEDEDRLSYVLLRLESHKAVRRVMRATCAVPGSNAGRHGEGGKEEEEDEEAEEENDTKKAHAPGLHGWLANATAEARRAGRRGAARALQAETDALVAAFEEQEDSAKRKKEELAARMQADGFTLVTRKTAVGAEAAEEGADGGGGAAKRKKKSRGALQQADFYRFQATDQKLDRLAELRAQFAEDKERVNKVKAARTFKPY